MQAPIPAPPANSGFVVTQFRSGEPLIEYRNQRGCVTFFLGVWLLFWTFGISTILLPPLLNGLPIDNDAGSFMGTYAGSWLFAAPFLLAELFVGGLFCWLAFGRSALVLKADAIEFERSCLGWRKQERFQRGEISKVRQIKDGGEDDDSFPTWGLELVGTRTRKILWRQPIESSDWLGPILAAKLNCEFEAEARRK